MFNLMCENNMEQPSGRTLSSGEGRPCYFPAKVCYDLTPRHHETIHSSDRTELCIMGHVLSGVLITSIG